MRKRSFLLVLALVVTSCGSGGGTGGSGDSTGGTGAAAPTGMIVDGKVTDEALAAIVEVGGSVDVPRLDALTQEVLALSDAERQAVLADLSMRTEVALAGVSGIRDAAGGEQGFVAEASRAWAPVDELVRTAVPSPAAGLRSRATSSTDGMAAMGLFMGFMGLGMTAGTMVSGTNRMEPDVVETSDGSKDGMSITSSLNAVSLGLQYKGTEKDGMEIQFAAKSELQVCPAENGLLDVSGLIDVVTRKDGKEQKATVDVTMRVQVGDDAEAVSKDGETRIKWSAFDGSTEQFVDVTYTSGAKRDVRINWVNIFTTTPEFARTAVVLGNLVGDMVLMFLFKAVEEGWKSGRCVQLDATPSAGPSGLEPGQTVTVSTQSRSKIDRSLTGGTVTAVLSAGENSIDPSATPLPLPGQFGYTGPSEENKTGTVDFESKSKRGIGKASITFDTSGARYTASYSGQGVTISGTIADLNAPFELESSFPGGTATMSFVPGGGDGGVVTVNGGGSGATLTGGGSYTVTDNPDGTKLLTASVNACVDVSGICGDATYPIPLTPVT